MPNQAPHPTIQEQQANLVVLRCLRRERQEEKIAGLKKVAANGWEAAVAAAESFSLGPLLFHTLKPFFFDLAIPEPLRQRLRNIYFSSAARNMRLYRQLLRILLRFNSEGVSIILLKGAHLAEAVYGNFALRPMADVDILARRNDLARIDQLLIELGYRSSEQSAGCALEHLAPYRKKDAAAIEVHFHIAPPPFSRRFDPAVLWERARKETFQGVEVLTLCPEDLLLHLCVHTCIHHGFDNGLIPFLDVDRAIEHFGGNLDWGKFLNRSRTWGMERCVYLMLSLTEKVIGRPLPEHVRQEMKPNRESWDALSAAEDLIFARGAVVPSHIARLFAQGWRSKTKYFLMRAFPPREIMFPAGQGPESGKRFEPYRLYWLRLRGLLKRHGKTIRAGLFKDPRTIRAIQAQNKRNNLKDWLMGTSLKPKASKVRHN